ETVIASRGVFIARIESEECIVRAGRVDFAGAAAEEGVVGGSIVRRTAGVEPEEGVVVRGGLAAREIAHARIVVRSVSKFSRTRAQEGVERTGAAETGDESD